MSKFSLSLRARNTSSIVTRINLVAEFGKPNKGFDSWMLGMPSIWAWQIIWWALGVGVIWFLANKLKMSTEPETEIKASSSD